MLASERHRTILALLRSQGGASSHELSRALGVSETTVRRDLAALDTRGALRRVSGGAVPADQHRAALPVAAPWHPYGIARAAAALVQPAATIAISGGAHTLNLARALSAVADLTVVTTSTPVADALHGAPHREHLVVGGISTRSGQVGALALAAIRSLHVGTLFLAVHGMHGRCGFTAATGPEAETSRALIGAARQVVVLADHTAWGRAGAAVAGLDRADVVVSDNALPTDARTVLSAQTGRLILADPRAPAPVHHPPAHRSAPFAHPPRKDDTCSTAAAPRRPAAAGTDH